MRIALAAPLLLAAASCTGHKNFFSNGPDDAGPDEDGGIASQDEIFSLDFVHEVSITVAEEDIPQLVPHNDVRVSCDVVFDGESLPNSGVKLKGGIGSVSTLDEKPGFSVKFDEFEPDQELRGLSRIVLNSFRQDRGMVSEHVGYALYRGVGIPGSRTAYAFVTFNGEPYGVYLVTEAVNGDFLDRNFGDDSGNLFEGNCCGELAVGFTELKNNGELAGDPSDLQDLIDVMQNAPDETYLEELDGVLDVDAFLRGWAIEAMVAHWDGYNYNRNNFYLYHRPSDGRFMFLPHGLDQLFGNLWHDPHTPTAAMISSRMQSLPEARARFDAVLREVATNEWDADALTRHLDAASSLIATRIDDDPRKYQSRPDQEGTAAGIRSFLTDRPDIILQILDAECGNGITEVFEECDDGNTDSEDGCNGICKNEFCGDGIRQRGLDEACDGIGCRGDCSGPSVCGDGLTDVGEECDDWNRTNGDGCTSRCTTDRCGDWILQPDETCDGPGCRPDCSEIGACGDGTVDVGEDCDDGNPDDGDACPASCSWDDCEAVVGPDGDYLFCTARRTWDQARQRCGALGATLVVPGSAGEADFVGTEAFGRNGEPWWIGIDDLRFEGVWTTPFVDGIPEPRWGDGEPNGGDDQDCGTTDALFGGGWNDKWCEEQHPSVCRLFQPMPF